MPSPSSHSCLGITSTPPTWSPGQTPRTTRAHQVVLRNMYQLTVILSIVMKSHYGRNSIKVSHPKAWNLIMKSHNDCHKKHENPVRKSHMRNVQLKAWSRIRVRQNKEADCMHSRQKKKRRENPDQIPWPAQKANSNFMHNQLLSPLLNIFCITPLSPLSPHSPSHASLYIT